MTNEEPTEKTIYVEYIGPTVTECPECGQTAHVVCISHTTSPVSVTMCTNTSCGHTTGYSKMAVLKKMSYKLNENDVKVLMAFRKIGYKSVKRSVIADASGIPRTTIFDTLERLIRCHQISKKPEPKPIGRPIVLFGFAAEPKIFSIGEEITYFVEK